MYYSSEAEYSTDTVYAFYPEYAFLLKDLYPHRGVDFSFMFDFKDRLGRIQPISGKLEGEVTEFTGSSKNIPITLTVVDYANGIVEMRITANDLKNLRRNIYKYTIRVVDGDKTSLLRHGNVVFTD